MNIRAKIFGENRPPASPIVTVKNAKGRGLSIPRQQSRCSNARHEDRYPALAHPARLTRMGTTYDVQLVNVCGGGAMVAVPFGASLWEQFELHLGENGTIDCSVIWVKGDRIGVEFAGETRLECSEDERMALIRDVVVRHFPEARVERPVTVAPTHQEDNRTDQRQPLVWSGTLHFDYDSMPARLRNISRSGAMIETDLKLSIGDEPLLDLGEAGAIFGTVIWISGDEVGIRFHQPFHLEALVSERPHFADSRFGAGWEGQWKRISLNELGSE